MLGCLLVQGAQQNPRGGLSSGPGVMEFVNAFILCTAALLLACRQSAALSFELCDSYGAEWVTDSPHLSGVYPFYSLIFSCNCAPSCQPQRSEASLLCSMLIPFTEEAIALSAVHSLCCCKHPPCP